MSYAFLDKAKAFVTGFFAKEFSGKTLVIVAVVALVVGILI